MPSLLARIASAAALGAFAAGGAGCPVPEPQIPTIHLACPAQAEVGVPFAVHTWGSANDALDGREEMDAQLAVTPSEGTPVAWCGGESVADCPEAIAARHEGDVDYEDATTWFLATAPGSVAFRYDLDYDASTGCLPGTWESVAVSCTVRIVAPPPGDDDSADDDDSAGDDDSPGDDDDDESPGDDDDASTGDDDDASTGDDDDTEALPPCAILVQPSADFSTSCPASPAMGALSPTVLENTWPVPGAPASCNTLPCAWTETPSSWSWERSLIQIPLWDLGCEARTVTLVGDQFEAVLLEAWDMDGYVAATATQIGLAAPGASISVGDGVPLYEVWISSCTNVVSAVLVE